MALGSGFASAAPSLANGGGGPAPSTTISGKKAKGDQEVAKAIEEEVDAAILSRQLSHPDKWSSLVIDSSAGGGPAEGEEESGQGAGGVPASGGGAGIPPRPSTGGGGSPSVPTDATAAAAASTKKGASGRKSRRSSAGMGSRKSSATEVKTEVTAVGDGGPGVPVLSKKEKKEFLVAQVRLLRRECRAWFFRALGCSPSGRRCCFSGEGKPSCPRDGCCVAYSNWGARAGVDVGVFVLVLF